MHKFSISGAHSTGKTALVDTIAERSLDVSVVHEVPRAICEELNDSRYFHRDRNSFAKQTLLVAQQMAAEATTDAANSMMVTDRCVADNWAYTQTQFPVECSGEIGSQWRKLVLNWMCTYDAVFIYQIEASLEEDSVRETDMAFQESIDRTIREMLGEVGSDVVELYGSTTERILAFAAAISRHSARIGWQHNIHGLSGGG